MRIKWSVRGRILGMVAVFVLGMLAFSAFDVYTTREMLVAEKRLKTRHLVESAYSVIDHYHQRQLGGLLTEAEAQAAAQEALRAMRYDGSEYFWIHELSETLPQMLMHPTLPELEGQPLDQTEYNVATSLQIGETGAVQPTDGRMNLFLAFNEVVRGGQSGYVTYQWPKPLQDGSGATQERYPKLSFVQRFDPWGWVVGSGIYTDDVDAAIGLHTMHKLGMTFVASALLVMLAGWLGASIARPLGSSARALREMSSGKRPLAPLPVEYEDEIGTLIAGFNQLQESVRSKEERLRLAATVFENSREGIVLTALDGSIIEVNPSFTDLTGYTPEEVVGKKPSVLKSGYQNQDFYAAMWRSLAEEGFWQGEIINRRKGGEVYVEMLTVTAVRNAQGEPSLYLGIFSDITALKEHQDRLEHLAHFDALTQLPNRVLFADRLHHALEQSARAEGLLAVAFLDLDEFKPVNDRLGHEAGDRLLVEVAQRLRSCVRVGDTVARFGGDEFVLLLGGLEGLEDVHGTLTRVLTALGEPVVLCGEQVRISASIGVTLYPYDGADPEVLLRHADQAMYAAKESGRSAYHLFDVEHDRRARLHRERLEEVRTALQAGQLQLYFQPKVNLRLGCVVGAEALLRWQHPQRGLLLPGDFLELVENTELGVDIGDWVIGEALRWMQRWHLSGLDLPVSVNISARQLEQAGFVTRLAQTLAAYPDLPPSSLELEILETAALEDLERVSAVMRECAEIGVHFALDDFGTGYSSLTYFKRLPARVLKIDKSFVIHMVDDPDDLAIVEGVIGFTHAFQREVVGEGVETAEHAAILLELGCEIAQGYGIARPMPAIQVLAWVDAFQPDPAWGGAWGVERGERQEESARIQPSAKRRKPAGAAALL